MFKDIKKLNTRAFTIIELMIATAVFTVVLLLASMVLLQIGKIYYKGTIEINTQDDARSIIDDISQSIQIGGGQITSPSAAAIPGGNTYFFCTGDSRYIFTTNTQFLDSVPGSHGFVRDNMGNGCPNPAAWPGGITDLLGQRMRVANFTLNKLGSTGLYSVKIRIVYGDDDLICDPTVQANCNNNTATNFALPIPNMQCKGNAGSQYCAVSELTTTVLKRI